MTLQFNAKITTRRQAQKDDLVDIARALGLVASGTFALPFLREKLDQHFRTQGVGLIWDVASEKLRLYSADHTSQQVTKTDLVGYTRALGGHASHHMTAEKIRGQYRSILTERAQRKEADPKDRALVELFGEAFVREGRKAQAKARAENSPLRLQRLGTAANKLVHEALDLINLTDDLPEPLREQTRAHLRAIVDLLNDE